MGISTRQYAKRQISWLRNKLLPLIYTTSGKEKLPAYLLDATGEPIGLFFLVRLTSATVLGEQWLTNVRVPAVQIMEGTSK